MVALQRTVLIAIAVLSLNLAGCFVGSKQPLSDPAKSAPDEQLFGFWLEKDSQDTKICAIGRANDGEKGVPPGLMRATFAGINKQNQVREPGSMLFFVSAVGDSKYINMYLFGEKGELDVPLKDWPKATVKSYILLKYRVQDDRLEYWIGTDGDVAEAIDKGLVKGEVTRDRNGRVKSAGLTDTTENLAHFLQNGGDKMLFHGEPSRVLRRLRPRS
jgi:hypothetical protein